MCAKVVTRATLRNGTCKSCLLEFSRQFNVEQAIAQQRIAQQIAQQQSRVFGLGGWVATGEAQQQMAQGQANGLGQHAAPGPCIDHVTRKEHRGVLSENVGLRSELADVKSWRDRLVLEKEELQVRVAFLERENVRLGGKKRGCR